MIQLGIAEADYGLGYLIWLNERILKKQGKQESKKIRKVIYDNLLHVRYNNEQEIHFNRHLRNLK